MLTLIQDYVSDAAAPFIFLALFLIIVGGALWLTPRLARWLDKQEKQNRGYFDGMLEEEPGRKVEEEDTHDREAD